MHTEDNSSVTSAIGTWPMGRLVKYDPSDYRRADLSFGLTPVKARAALRAADDGDYQRALELFEEIEDKDPRLQSVLGTRRLALTGMEWEIVSASEFEGGGRVDKVLAEEAAAFARDRLGALADFEQALTDLSLAIGPGLAVLELIWDGQKLVAIDAVPSSRLFVDFNRDKHVRVALQPGERRGIIGTSPNFVTHMPHAKHGLPMRGSLIRAILLIYLIRNYAIKDWAIFSEVFGMPLRMARYEANATSKEKTEMLDMLRLIGTDAVAIFSKAIDLDIKEAGDRRGAPYAEMVNWAAREMAVAILGQNLTTDTTGGTGTFAAAEVQDRVREDLLEADMKAEARTVRNAILTPMVRYEFSMPESPVPYFRRKSREVVDRIQEGQVIQSGVNLGLKIQSGYAYERLGIPVPEGVDPKEFLEPKQPPASGLGGLFPGAGG